MNRKSQKKIKKDLAKSSRFTLACVLAVETLGLAIIPTVSQKKAKDLKGEAMTNAVGRNVTNINGVSVALDQTLDDNGDGTYTLKLKSSSNLKFEDLSVKKTKIKYGYYEAPQTGNYLVEIFGGDGARGQNTVYSEGGSGGKGAHIYADIALTKGDILVYTIGGNGQMTLSDDTGGGANGDGGSHGDNGSYYVGGGGGYTAVYLFKNGSEANDFYGKYVTNGVISLEDSSKFEADRISKYIMIAGGGGGGGAGNAFSISDKAIRKPDGGSAGDFTSPYGVLGEEYAVPGTYYAGSDGYSSGKRQDYVGKGGGELPGAVNSTFFELFDGKEPNDWKATMNSKMPGGSGGAGNLRGGAGGAGYAGGSGGIMTGLLIGTNVGGGGGGSSFLASSKRADIVIPSAGDDAMKYVSGTNESDEGGAVYISYMPTAADFEHLDNLIISGEISQYFNIESCTSDNGDVTVSGRQITVKNVKSSPSFLGGAGKSTTITMKLKPIDGFMGGNDVPIFKPINNKEKVTYTSAKGIFDMDLNESCSYVNIPYAFDLQTFSFTKSSDDNQINIADLYKDNEYVKHFNAKENTYDFIKAVSNYKVEANKQEIKTAQYTLDDDTEFTVSYEVEPKEGNKAVVGERLSKKVFKKTAKVNLIEISNSVLNGNTMSYQKTLNYDSETDKYIFTINMKTSGPTHVDHLGVNELFAHSASEASGSYTTGNYVVQNEGDYILQLWGGNGGQGGNDGLGGSGAKGGTGTYLSKTVHLQSGDTLTYYLGANGQKGNNSGTGLNYGYRGYPGMGSALFINETAVLGSAGGGGGGGGSWLDTGLTVEEPGQNGSDGGTITSLTVSNLSSLTGTPNSSSRTHNRGNAGSNYTNSTYFTNHPVITDAPTNGFKESDYSDVARTNNNGGAFRIVSLPDKNEVFDDYSISPVFTDNFVVDENVTVTGASSFTKSGLNVTDIIPNKTISNGVVSFSVTATYSLSVNTDNCIGGFDIKLLDSLTIGQIDKNGNLLDDSNTVEAQDATDYANVKLNSKLIDSFELETFDKDYMQGSAAINPTSLYEASNSLVKPDNIQIKEANASESISGEIKPNTTTDYKISYGVEAIRDESESAHRAVVGPNVDPLLIEKNARVNVYNQLTYSLENVTCDAEKTNINGNDYYLFVPGQDYEVEFEPAAGMELAPESISVTDNEVELEEDDYTISSGVNGALVLKIKGSALTPTSKIVISAKATVRKFDLHYLVSIDASGYVTKDFVVQLEAGATGEDFDPYLEELLNNYPVDKAPEVKGYQFVIEYPDGVPLTSMPAYDVWINGVYEPLPHSLEIHYVDSTGTDIATPHIENDGTCYYKKDIDVITPEVSKYAPSSVHSGTYTGDEKLYNPSRIQFTMPDEDVKLYVVYDSIATGGLVINYTSKDTIALPAQHTESGTVGANYEINLPSIDGYEPVIYDSEGVMTKLTDGKLTGSYLEDGELVTVTYEPKIYTISFYDKAEGGTQLFEDRTVFYNHEIGYTGESYENATFTNLPTPVKVGYEFAGWMLNGFLVDCLSVYDLTEDTILTPTWSEATYTVTVRYFADSGKPTLPKTEVLSGKYGETYELVHPTISGYHLTEETAKLSGTFTGSNIIVDVTYLSNTRLNSVNITGYDEEITYSGSLYEPTLTITYIPEGTSEPVTLYEGVDFEVDYDQTTDVGDHTITINFIGEFEGNDEIELIYEIVEKQISKDDDSLQITGINESYSYSGKAVEPLPIVTYNGTKLVRGTDYDLSYVNNVSLSDETNKAQVVITFKGNYEGKVTKDFMIVAGTIDSGKVGYGTIEDRVYDGNQHTPTTTVTYDGVTLTPGIDYEFTYGENIHVGKGYVYVNFKGGFVGNAPFEIQFNIIEKKVSSADQSTVFTISPDISEPILRPNTGTTPNLMPITILDNETGKELRSPEDFTIEFDDQDKAYIVFNGDYKESDPIEIPYEVKDLIVNPLDDEPFTGQAIEPKPVITFNGDALVEGRDYILHYDDNSELGEHEITIEYIGFFKDMPNGSVTYEIIANRIDIDELSIEGIEPQEFTGSQITPSVVIKYGEYTLLEETDYFLEYGENIHVGEDAGSVIITLKGNFRAIDNETETVNFDILPKQVQDPDSDFEVVYEDGESYPSVPTVKDGDNELRYPDDYDVIYDGTDEGTIVFKGDYEGNDPIKFDIEKTEIDVNDLEIIIPEDVTFDGTSHNPTDIVVKYNNIPLVEGVDYELTYGENIHAGSNAGEVYITLIGGYKAEDDEVLTVYFDIIPKKVEDSEKDFDVTPQPYPELPIVKDGEHELRNPEDFEVSYDDEGHGTITFKGDYEGNDPITFDVVKTTVDVNDLLTSGPKDVVFNGNQQTPTDIVVVYNGYTLIEGTDYELSYGENVHVGTNEGEVYIKLIGGFEAEDNKEKTVYFSILAKHVDDPDNDFTVTYEEGESYPSVPVVKDGDNELRYPDDYEVIYDGTDEGTIVFKGDYEGNDPIKFDIEKTEIDVNDLEVTGPADVTYNGEKHEPTDIVVKYGDYTLIKDVDYELTYPTGEGDNVHVGEGEVYISLIGGFKAEDDESKTVTFQILPKQVDDPDNDFTVEYKDGESYPSIPVVKDGDNELRYPDDYEVIYDGTDEGTIVFKGDYEGNDPIKFDIEKTEIDIDDLEVTGPADVTYNGEKHEPTDIVVKYGDYTLIKDVDYELTYPTGEGDNVHVGEGEVYISLIGGYEDVSGRDKTQTFQIKPAVVDGFDIKPEGSSDDPIIISKDEDTFDTDDIVIKGPFSNEPLVEGEDYDVIVDDDNGTITITFKGDYEGNEDIVEHFRHESGGGGGEGGHDGPYSEPIPEQEYDPDGNEPKPDIKDENGEPLVEGEDYELQYGEDEDGNPEVIVHFLPPYDDEEDLHIPYEIVPKELENPEITFETEKTPYNGEPVTPGVIVKDGEHVLEEGVDYVIHYADNNQPGTGKALIEFIGNYASTGVKTVEFEIKATSLDNRTSAEGRATVIVTYEEGFDSDITLYAVARESVPTDIEDQAKIAGRFYGTYGDYEIKLFDGEGNEVQPEDIEPGTVLTLRIELPSELEGRDVSLVHYHSADDVTLIVRGEEAGIGTYIIDEEGYLVTQINKFSDFSIIYEETCIAHWFLITAAILDILLIGAIIMMGKKQSKAVGVAATLGLAVMTGIGAIFAHCALCYVMLGINGLLILFNILFFAMWQGKEQPEQAQPQVVYVQSPVAAAPAQVAVAPIAKAEESNEPLTLKESMAKAAVTAASQTSINKVVIANWLSETYGDKVTVNHRENMTSTGLPLADTHYIEINGDKKCFIYVYEVNNNCFFLVRSDDATIAKVRSHNHKAIPSAFPKTRDYAKWYTLLMDNSYANNESVFVTLKFIISHLGVAEAPAAPVVETAPAVAEAPAAPAVEEIKEDLSLKESISEAKAKAASVEVCKESIAKFLSDTYGDKVIVNVRENMTSTGLPLADTHYIYLGENKKCFIYVYNVDGKVFCIVRSDDETAKEVKGLGHIFARSAFPKTRDYAKWYTMLFDESYKSSEEVFSTLKLVVDALGAPKAEVKAEPVVEETPVVEEVKEDLSLKESMLEAKETVNSLSINKEVVANYLSAKYGEKVVINTRGNMTSTGLPLADTHYLYIGEDKKCFIYIYDVDGKVFFIVRGNEDIAKAVKAKKHRFVSSAFPKTRDYAKWYTMLIDDSYASNEAVFETLDVVIEGLLGNNAPVEAEPVKAEPVVEEPVKEDLSLKESIAEAKAHESKLEVNKKVVAEYLAKAYGEKVVVNTRENMTSTGLPLADTHYLYIGEDKKCFIYVYNLEGKVFFIVRGNEDIAKAVKGLKHKFISSAFPKTRDYAKWYTMIIDDSYKSNEDVFKALDAVVGGLSGAKAEVKEEPVVEEPEANDLSLKESIAKAAEVKANVVMNKENIAKWLKETYGDKVTVNVRESMTSTGLPLADTHYIEKDGVKKCFIYIYELNGNCFAIVRSDEETAKVVRQGKHKFISSAFPKTRDYAKWYTMLFDDSYANSSEVFETLAKVIDGIKLK